MFERTSCQRSSINPPHLLVALLATGLSVPALLGQSAPFPTYTVGANSNQSQGPKYGSTSPSPWVVSNGQIITPAGTPVYLGTTTRAKAVALNPNYLTRTAAVLQMGGPQAVTIFNTLTGAVLQTYSTPYLSGSQTKNDSTGSHNGIAYTPDGLHLLYSQDEQPRYHRQRRSEHGHDHIHRRLKRLPHASRRSDRRRQQRQSDHRYLLL